MLFYRGVEVYKLSGNSSCPWDGYKGTTDINLPLSYVVQYVLNLEYKKEWDDLFQGRKYLMWCNIFLTWNIRRNGMTYFKAVSILCGAICS